MYTATQGIEKIANPLILIKILFERGFMAWVELIMLTTAIVLPSFLLTKLLERISSNLYPELTFWKSLLFSISFTLIFYFIALVIMEPIKHV
jgi:hypothetical protein